MSFNPNEDGSKIWEYMHTMAANAITIRKRELYVYWLNSLKEAFPCEKCRIHLISNLEEFPVETYSSTNVSLFYHSWRLHDIVNEQLSKPSASRLSYAQAFQKYFKRPLPQESNNIESAQTRTYPTAQNMGTKTAPLVTTQNERHMVSSSNQTGSSGQPGCDSCGVIPVEYETPKTYTAFREQIRRSYLPKN